MTCKNNKSKHFDMRLTEDEFDMISRCADDAGMNRTEYILSLVERDAKTEQADGGNGINVYREGELQKLIWHLSKWGNNLNQITYTLNKIAKSPYAKQEKVLKELKRVAWSAECSNEAIDGMLDIAMKLYEEKHIVLKKRKNKRGSTPKAG